MSTVALFWTDAPFRPPRARRPCPVGPAAVGDSETAQHPMTPCHLPRGQLYCHDFLATDEERREDVGHDHRFTIHRFLDAATWSCRRAWGGRTFVARRLSQRGSFRHANGIKGFVERMKHATGLVFSCERLGRQRLAGEERLAGCGLVAGSWASRLVVTYWHFWPRQAASAPRRPVLARAQVRARSFRLQRRSSCPGGVQCPDALGESGETDGFRCRIEPSPFVVECRPAGARARLSCRPPIVCRYLSESADR